MLCVMRTPPLGNTIIAAASPEQSGAAGPSTYNWCVNLAVRIDGEPESSNLPAPAPASHWSAVIM